LAAPHGVSRLGRVLVEISAQLREGERPWALLGGLAVSVYVPPRFTRDVDVAVAVANDADAEALVYRLQLAGFSVLGALEQEAVRRLATVRLTPPGEGSEGVVVDLMFASSGIESEICLSAEPIEVLPGVLAPVARPGHLVALKLLARDDVRRPQDIADIRALMDVLDDDELERAQRAVALIKERGFDRGRDLSRALADVVSDASS